MVRKKKGLGERHRKILAFIEQYQNETGFPPTIREIGKQVGISSTSVVNYYLDQLEEWGFIERQRKISRGVRLSGQGEFGIGRGMLKIPVLGRIVAGAPIPVPPSDFHYYDAETSVDIARTLLPASKKPEELFALEVEGDSMIDAMVNDGDIVILKRVEEARNGEMVAVWLPERNETTLKYFYKEKDRYRLQPANPTMKPIYIDKSEPVEIRGTVVMVVRQVQKTH
jgi:repressor LexA